MKYSKIFYYSFIKMFHLIPKETYRTKILKYVFGANYDVLIKNKNNLSENMLSTEDLLANHNIIHEKIKIFSKEKQNILVISHEASVTGAPVLCLNIIRALKIKYNVIFLSLGPGELESDFEYFSNYSIILQTKKYNNVDFLFKLYELKISKFKPKVFLVNSICSAPILEVSFKKSIPSVLLVHEFPYSANQSELDNITLSNYAVFSSNFLYNSYSKELRDKISNYCIFPQGDSTYNFSIQPNRDSNLYTTINRIRNLSRQYKVCVSIGYGKFRKGFDLFLITASEVIKKDKNSFFIWIGDFDNQSDFNLDWFVKSEINVLNLQDRVLFLNGFKGLDFIFPYITLLFCCSRLDPLPNVVMMSMRYSKPFCIFDRISGYSELLKKNGLDKYCLANYLDPYDLSEKIYNLLANGAILEQIGKKMNNILHTEYSMENYCSKLTNLFRFVIENNDAYS